MARRGLLLWAGLLAALLSACSAQSRPGSEPGGDVARRPAPLAEKDYPAHVAALRARLPHDGFSIVVQPPFVVVGDEEREVVERRARRTVKWAVDLLRKDYFERDPAEILDIWLFRDARSYREHTRQVFGEVPGTRFGYYSPAHRALIMNIATGGGTLVHEIVHPFMQANFPECPPWFNEGLGSLYEQCEEREGRIAGLTNWRLRGLQGVIRRGALPSFESLTGASEEEFYGEDEGTYYAQARYLCLYLQERGLLREFYRRFRRGVRRDPTGYATLRGVLGRTDMAGFEAEWGEWVLGLRY